MRSIATTLCTLSLVLAAGGVPVATAAASTPQALLADAIRAAGGTPAMERIGYLRLEVVEEETSAKGETRRRTWRAVVRTKDLLPARLELSRHLVLVDNAAKPFAVVRGEVDRREDSPMKTRGTVHAKLVPLLVPFSLRTPGLELSGTGETTIEGRRYRQLELTARPGFFIHATMNTRWWVALDPDTLRVELAGFSPPEELRVALPEDVVYRYLRWTTVGGVRLPSHVVIEGVDPASGTPTGHVRVTRIRYSVVEQPDPLLFANPDLLEALDEGDIVPE